MLTKSKDKKYLSNYKILGRNSKGYEKKENSKRKSSIKPVLDKYKKYIYESSIYPVKIMDDYGNNTFKLENSFCRYIHIRKTINDKYKVKVYDIYNQGEMEFITELKNLENLLEFLIRCIQTMEVLKKVLGKSSINYEGLDLDLYKTELVLDSNMKTHNISMFKTITFFTFKDLIENYKSSSKHKSSSWSSPFSFFFGEEIENPVWFI